MFGKPMKKSEPTPYMGECGKMKSARKDYGNNNFKKPVEIPVEKGSHG